MCIKLIIMIVNVYLSFSEYGLLKGVPDCHDGFLVSVVFC